MLFVDHIRDHDVADAAVEGGGLTEDVDTPKCADAFRDFAQDVVGAQSQGIVDVDQDRGASLQPVRGRRTQPGVEVARHQTVENDDLRRHVKAGLAGKEKDAALLFLPRPMRPPLPRLRGLRVVGAGGVIQKVVPVAARLTLTEFAQLGHQFEVVAALRILHDLLLMAPGRAAQQVDDAVRVAGDEIHRSLLDPLPVHQIFDRLPPATGRLDIADLAATQHAHAEILFLRLDAAQRGQQVAPDLDQSQGIVFRDTQAL